MSDIVQKEDRILRGKAEDVLEADIKSAKIKKVITDMKEALERESDGVAIAAPQIGVPLSIFVISYRVFEIMKELGDKQRKISDRDLVFINPKLTRLSREKEWVEEGCLSVRWLYGKVNRSKKAKITALNENGVLFEMGGSGLLAQVFQHECDHLSGTLFIDKAKEIHELSHDEIAEVKKASK